MRNSKFWINAGWSEKKTMIVLNFFKDFQSQLFLIYEKILLYYASLLNEL